jgi:hypothetical protein
LVINAVQMATNQGCKGLVPASDLNHKFLYYYLSSIVGLLNSLGTGATFKELSGGKLKEVAIPVPPLPQQQRIVGILDQAFEAIATAKANAEKNLQNARAIFESHLDLTFSYRGDWEEDLVGSICVVKHGFAFDGSDFSSDVPECYPKVITPGNFTEDGKLLFNKKNVDERSRNPRRAHRPRAEGRRLGRGGGQPRPARVPITLGRLRRQRATARQGRWIADYVLVYRNTKLAVVEAKAWDKPLTEGVGQAKDYAGKLAVRFAYATNGQGSTASTWKRAMRASWPATRAPDELWKRTFRAERLARPLRRRALRGQGRLAGSPRYYQDIAIERVLALIAAVRPRPHPADAGHRHGQDLHRLPDRLEAVPEPLEPGSSGGEPTRRPRILFLADRNILADQAYNAFSAFPKMPGAHRARRHSQEGQGAEERQHLLHHLPDLHERARRRTGSRRPTSASTRRTSSTSSSSTSATGAAPTTKAPGATSSTTSRLPCSSA